MVEEAADFQQLATCSFQNNEFDRQVADTAITFLIRHLAACEMTYMVDYELTVPGVPMSLPFNRSVGAPHAQWLPALWQA